MAQLRTLADRQSPEREMIPRVLLWAMFALAMITLAIVSLSVVTNRPHVGVPPAATAVQERWLVLEGKSAQAVVVRDADGTLLMDLPHGGFITVIQSAMARARLVAQIPGNPPMRVVRYDNGRLVAEDPATGWSAELYAFGGDNKAAFERLLDQTK
ncbi:photosynthetic complex assembly protein PuhC [Pseudotabrizicola sp. 4114]|uniref:photosynthetic complex assembly protein PuhC n=1 Tax=Pseudotabrizicola sp. 4114 TaxID=2817731 RepID=UPI00286606FF|nr:putative photosynthetic complex assembly protein [Pseudorhodobacter sp. 4114]